MSKRPRADLNGKDSYPYWMEGFTSGKPPTPQRRRSRRLPWSTVLWVVGLVTLPGVIALLATRYGNQLPIAIANRPVDSFQLAVNRASSAAELTQTATSHAEWLTIKAWWQEAIDLMNAVPISGPNHAIAQTKAKEYRRNLEYAHSMAMSHSTEIAQPQQLWAMGSPRSELLHVQGDPTEAVRYDSTCKEILYYGESSVELNNGVVTKFEDVDRNLKVYASNLPVSNGTLSYWTLGSSREQVVRLQGTPGRFTQEESLGKEFLQYGDSSVDITDGKVTGYANLDDALTVSVEPLATPQTGSTNSWTIGSERSDVFSVQGTPTRVTEVSSCVQILHYDDSIVQLRNGFVTEYHNFDDNLRVSLE
ncbi:MAG: hypothetical protein HC881_16100 [Leptolyngbyaceae cyanobacterium SL_7_1]|nr:hypothetical protein [Leptolyngbyaceae cyanobacterium SL_7_1]